MDESRNLAQQEFPEDGVSVNFPGQARPLRVQRLDLPPQEIMRRTVPGGFQPFRMVINLRLVDAAQPDQEVTVFDPPIEIRVRYTAADLKDAAAAGKPLCLGYWNGKQWLRFTPEKHQFHLEPGNPQQPGGWGVVSISHWDDPTKAWGT